MPTSIKLYSGLTVLGSVGASYKIEYKNDLNDVNWTTLTNVVLPSSPHLFIDVDSPNQSQRFYRAVLAP